MVEERLADYYEYPPVQVADWILEFCFAADHADFSVPVLRDPERRNVIAVWNEDEDEIVVFEYESEDDADDALRILSKLAEATEHVFVPSRDWIKEVLSFMTHVKESYVIKPEYE